MIARVLWVFLGLVLAFLAAGLAIVLFVDTPLELLAAGPDKAAESGLLALAAATHSAVFAAPLALATVILGERRRFAGVLFYVVAGILIAAIGFLVEYWAQEGDAASIANTYAVLAFLVSGLVGGLIYWLVAGRRAGRGATKEGRESAWSADASAENAPASGAS